MKPLLLKMFALSALLGASPALAQNPASGDLDRHMIERRAIEAVIWGMPAVNYDLMLQEMLTKTPGKVHQVIYWGRPLDSKNQTLMPKSRRTLLHDLSRHEGRADRARPAAR